MNGITFLNSDYNAITFKVYASQAMRVAFSIGTGGNTGSAAYSGTNYTKPYDLVQGWNTITVCFDVDVYVPNYDVWSKADVI